MKTIESRVVSKCFHERKYVVLFLKQWYNFKKEIGNSGEKHLWNFG